MNSKSMMNSIFFVLFSFLRGSATGGRCGLLLLATYGVAMDAVALGFVGIREFRRRQVVGGSSSRTKLLGGYLRA